MLEEHLNREQIERIDEELNAENKIEAIKIFRDLTGMGLKESKSYVEDHIKDLIERDPEKYGHLLSGGNTGCFAILLLLFGIIPVYFLLLK